ncbi:hypothetical protein [Nonomuraea typhae]|uniref:Uncharacterized protein n=1 Tax=Nonomuraea typhae TaxID=2603600 RepID=A0ABW7YU18_9ACTN
MNPSPAAIAAELGLPVSRITDALLLKIAEDELFLHHLEMCRTDERLMSILLRETEATAASPQGQSTPELLRRASLAVVRWASSGFRKVSQAAYDRRLAACLACEHLVAPTENPVYRFTGARSVCNLCGCETRRKARLPAEACPIGRWGEER